MRLLIETDTADTFVEGYLRHWQAHPPGGPVQQAQALRLVDAAEGELSKAVRHVLDVWRSFGLFEQSYKVAYAGLAKQEKDRYGDMLGEADRERLALVDALPGPGVGKNKGFAKLGIIPAMGCPQACRHCMLI